MSSGEAPPEQEPAPPPAKKRKKKRKLADAGGALDARQEWPGFARNFPRNPAVEALVLAFEQGNYASVREGAKKILDQSKDRDERAEKGASATPYREKGEELPHPLPPSPEERDAIRSAARELLRRTEPDPLAVYMVLGAVALLAFLTIWYWSHPHGAAP
jgi:hypothetical protein